MAVEVPSPGAAARATPVASRAAPRWLAPVVDYGPISIFTVAYCGFDVLTATAAMVVATIAALGLSLALTRRVPITSLIVALTVIAFGGLTLWLRDERYLELQSTLINLLFSLVLWSALALRQPLLRAFFGVALRMTDRGWRDLTIRFALFFAAMAAINETISRTQSTDVWAVYYSFGTVILTLVFLAAQWPLIRRETLGEPEAPPEEDIR